jgi:hypothetical protein
MAAMSPFLLAGIGCESHYSCLDPHFIEVRHRLLHHTVHGMALCGGAADVTTQCHALCGVATFFTENAEIFASFVKLLATGLASYFRPGQVLCPSYLSPSYLVEVSLFALLLP